MISNSVSLETNVVYESSQTNSLNKSDLANKLQKAITDDNTTDLHNILDQQPEIATQLLPNNEYPFSYALKEGHIAAAKTLLKEAFFVKLHNESHTFNTQETQLAIDTLQDDTNFIDKLDSNSIHTIIRESDLDLSIIDKAIQEGADINEKDFLGYTALHHAAALNNYHAFSFLLASGAQATILSDNGVSVHDILTQTIEDIESLTLTNSQIGAFCLSCLTLCLTCLSSYSTLFYGLNLLNVLGFYKVFEMLPEQGKQGPLYQLFYSSVNSFGPMLFTLFWIAQNPLTWNKPPVSYSLETMFLGLSAAFPYPIWRVSLILKMSYTPTKLALKGIGKAYKNLSKSNNKLKALRNIVVHTVNLSTIVAYISNVCIFDFLVLKNTAFFGKSFWELFGTHNTINANTELFEYISPALKDYRLATSYRQF